MQTEQQPTAQGMQVALQRSMGEINARSRNVAMAADQIKQAATKMEQDVTGKLIKLRRRIQAEGVGSHPLLENEYLRLLDQKRQLQSIFALSLVQTRDLDAMNPAAPGQGDQAAPDAPEAGEKFTKGAVKREWAEGLPTVVVACVTDYVGRVLVVRRSANESNRAGEWEVPGGHRDPGESIMDCCYREVREECGLNLWPAQGMIRFDLRDRPGEYGVMLRCHMLAPDQQIDLDLNEHDAYEWVWADDLDRFQPVPPNFAKNVRELLALDGGSWTMQRGTDGLDG